MSNPQKYLPEPQVDPGYGYDQGPSNQRSPMGEPAPAYPGGGQVGYAPAASTTNVIVVNQQPTGMPQNQMILGSVGGHRDWNTDMFACMNDAGGCIWTWCCTPCVLAEISTKLGENACVTCCVPGASMTLRTRIRTLGGIQGSICKDCCAMSWCYLCAICQMSRELTAMGL